MNRLAIYFENPNNPEKLLKKIKESTTADPSNYHIKDSAQSHRAVKIYLPLIDAKAKKDILYAIVVFLLFTRPVSVYIDWVLYSVDQFMEMLYNELEDCNNE